MRDHEVQEGGPIQQPWHQGAHRIVVAFGGAQIPAPHAAHFHRLPVEEGVEGRHVGREVRWGVEGGLCRRRDGRDGKGRVASAQPRLGDGLVEQRFYRVTTLVVVCR